MEPNQISLKLIIYKQHCKSNAAKLQEQCAAKIKLSLNPTYKFQCSEISFLISSKRHKVVTTWEENGRGLVCRKGKGKQKVTWEWDSIENSSLCNALIRNNY